MEIWLLHLVNGISYGMILFLIASGLSLILGVMGILNLTHGSLYMLGAYIGLTLTIRGTDFWLAALLGGLAAGLIGIVLVLVFLGHLHRQYGDQVLLTLGFVYIFANVTMWIWGPWPKTVNVPSLLATSIDFGDLSFPLYRFALIIIGLAVAAALWWFQEKTKAGAIVRAGMDDKQMTIGLGLNYGLISTAIFGLGAFVAGFAGFIGGPLLGASHKMGLPILLLATIVVVIGGVGKVQGALLGALLIGLVDAFGKAFFPDLAQFTVYLLFIIVLLVKPSGLLGRERREEEDRPVSSVSIQKRVERQAFGQDRKSKLLSYAPYVSFVVILAIWPLFMGAYLQSMMAKILIFGIFALSLNLLYGYTGLFSLGHAAFFGVAGYTAGILMVHYDIKSFWVVAPAGVLAATFLAAIFGPVALRVSGIYFLFVTFALGQLLSSVALKWRSVTGGSNGLFGISYPDLGLPFTMTSRSFYYLVFIILVICMFLLHRFVNSPFGEALQGIREDERRMQHLGYHTWLYKYIAFVVAGLFAGVSGVLLGSFSGVFAPDYLGIKISTLVMLMVIIGSESFFFGPFIGAAVVVLLEHYSSIFAPERWPLILGAAFVISVMFFRGGIGIQLVRLWNSVTYGYGSSKY
jgi:branched-chain amino acid transport system permease protein